MHRDAETESIDKREEEIRAALEESARGKMAPVICVVPVRMQEAWLLIDETALRRAAGNPAGSRPLDMPDVTRLEDLPDPKRTLHDLLRQASELHGRRLTKFNRDLGSLRIRWPIGSTISVHCANWRRSGAWKVMCATFGDAAFPACSTAFDSGTALVTARRRPV